ncbi:MAG TPA: alpha/beta hydrolase, partial [Thermobifida alba]|nr:alpha/beta hydrolase [Thermobifida alba]
DNARHLWVGEPYVRIVLNEIVKRVAPRAYPLPTEWDGPYEKDTLY